MRASLTAIFALHCARPGPSYVEHRLQRLGDGRSVREIAVRRLVGGDQGVKRIGILAPLEGR